MQARDLVHHGLAIKRHAAPATVASLVGLPEDQVAAILADAKAKGRAIETQGAYALTPLARLALEGKYSLFFADARDDAGFHAAYERFEVINRSLKQLITDWQTIQVGGEALPNDHRDEAYDRKIIDRLGALHEQIEPVLKTLALRVPRLVIYLDKLLVALEKSEDGEIAWVSDVHRESYHTVWFELHEDLLRIMGRIREE